MAVGYTGGDPTKVSKAGDTMTGPLVLAGDPATDLQAADKAYVDTHGGGGGGGTPSDTVVTETGYGQSSTAGAGSEYSRGDHTHGSTALTASTATTSAVGDAATVGTGSTPARTDHVHGREGFGAVAAQTTFGQSSTNGAAATVARSDHAHGSPPLASVAATTSAVGDAAAVGAGATASRVDHVHGREAFGSAPATTEAIGTAAAAGSASTPARSDHVHPLAAAAVAGASAVGDAAATGAATTFAASDHRHGREAFGAPGSSAVADAVAAGVATTVAHSDHTHGREAFGAATAQTSYGASSGNGTATTVAHSDHTHGTPSLTGSSASTSAVADAATVGTATTPARADHVHGREAFAAPGGSAVADVAAAGSATTVARSDHKHGRESFGAVTAQTTFSASSTNGAATTLARSDHAHGTPATPADNTSAQKVIVALAGSDIGTRHKINLIAGTNVGLTVADDSGNDRVNVTVSASGGGGGGAADGGYRGVWSSATTYIAGDTARQFGSTFGALAGNTNHQPVPVLNMLTGPPGTPDVGPDGPNELGVIFTVSAPRRLLGIAFWKSTANTGVHTGSLWSVDSTLLLGRRDFTGETASGRQFVQLGADLWPGETYQVSYACPNGHYGADSGYYTSPVTVDVFTVPATGGKFGALGSRPTSQSGAANYWVWPVYEDATFDSNWDLIGRYA